MNNMIVDRVRVQIFGREYEMDPGGLTPLEVQSLAHFVDERMREISDRFGLVDTQKIAVLASINIALDYMQLKDRYSPQTDEVTPKLENLQKILEQALNA